MKKLRISKRYFISMAFLILSALFFGGCGTCLTGGYQLPETPPELGPHGWPVGLWRDGKGNEIRLNTNGTGTYTSKRSGFTNTHLVWENNGDRIRIDMWITTPYESPGLRDKAPERANQEVKEYLASIQDHRWWDLNYSYPGHAFLTGTVSWPDRYFWFKDSGEVYKIEYRGIKSEQRTFQLIELESSVVQKQKQREEELAREQRARDEVLAIRQKLKQAENKRKTAPPELHLKARYVDDASSMPNNSLDGGEEAVVSVTIENRGKGIAYDTKIRPETDYGDIHLPGAISVNNIEPGESKRVQFKIKAGFGVRNGRIPLKIVCVEKRGHSGHATLFIPAVSLKRPNLILDKYEITDYEAESVIGNGNGIPESGETIQIRLHFKNIGSGKPIDAKLLATSDTPDISIKNTPQRMSDIAPGQTATDGLIISVPRSFAGNKILLNLKATDSRGFTIFEKMLDLKAEAIVPELVYSCKIFDKAGKRVDGNPGRFIENGFMGKLEIAISNKGKAAAKNVLIVILSDRVYFQNKQEEVGAIDAESNAVPKAFAFQVPRTIGNDPADVLLEINQLGFPGLQGKVSIPHRPFTP